MSTIVESTALVKVLLDLTADIKAAVKAGGGTAVEIEAAVGKILTDADLKTNLSSVMANWTALEAEVKAIDVSGALGLAEVVVPGLISAIGA